MRFKHLKTLRLCRLKFGGFVDTENVTVSLIYSSAVYEPSHAFRVDEVNVCLFFERSIFISTMEDAHAKMLKVPPFFHLFGPHAVDHPQRGDYQHTIYKPLILQYGKGAKGDTCLPQTRVQKQTHARLLHHLAHGPHLVVVRLPFEIQAPL